MSFIGTEKGGMRQNRAEEFRAAGPVMDGCIPDQSRREEKTIDACLSGEPYLCGDLIRRF